MNGSHTGSGSQKTDITNCSLYLILGAVHAGAGDWDAAQQAATNYNKAYLLNMGDAGNATAAGAYAASSGQIVLLPQQQQMCVPVITRCHDLLGNGSITCTSF